MPAIRKAATAAVLVAALGLPGAEPAAAQSPGPEGAERLRAAVERMIERQHRINTPEARVVWKGRPVVEPRGDAYLVRMPHLSVSGPGYLLDVGALSAVARDAGDGSFVLREAVPAAAVLHAAYGPGVPPVPAGELRIGGGTSQAVIDADGLVGDAEIRLTELTAEIPAEDLHLTLAEASLVQEVGPSAARSGDLDVAYAYRLAGLDARERADGPTVIGLGEVVLDGHLHGLSRVALLDMVDGVLPRILALAEAAEAGPPDGPEAMEMLDGVFVLLAGMADGIGGGLSVEGLRFSDPQGGAGFSLGRAAYAGGLSGILGERAAATLSASVEGVSGDAGLDVPPDAVPDRVAFALGLEELPLREVLETVRRAARTELSGGRVDEDRVQGEVLGALMAAGTRLRIDELALDAPAFGVSAEGRAALDPSAALQATAGFNVFLRGLEEALRVGEAVAGGPQPEIGIAVSVLTAMGRLEKDAQGRDVRRYDLELGADGKALLNGADMAPIIRSMSGGR